MPLAGTARPLRLLTELDEIYPDQSKYQKGSLSESEIADWIMENPQLANELRLVLSLSDKRFYLDLSYLLSRKLLPGDESGGTVCGCLPHQMKKHNTSTILNMVQNGSTWRRRSAAEVIANYLSGRGLLIVLDLYFGLDHAQRKAVNNLWLAPHDVQQNETKRRGHGAEAEIAIAFNDVGIGVIPESKATDPMGSPDPNISLDKFQIVPRRQGETVSSDIAVLDDEGKLQVIIMGLVQSSDPGQFGVDKAATNTVIRQKLDDFRNSTGSTLELWGIIDGIGYAENPNGTVNRMLDAFDLVIQHNSAYKAIFRAHQLGLCKVDAVLYDADFYSDMCAEQMHQKYGGKIRRIKSSDEIKTNNKAVRAGRATLWLKS